MSKSESKELKNVVSLADRKALEEGYTFVPSEKKPTSWQERMILRYHDGLYKEYALADLSRAPLLGLRWRTRQEVVDGRGERSCGNKRCHNTSNLSTLEVPFKYVEGKVTKKELVKLRLCPSCKPLISSKSKTSERTPERISGRRRDSDSDDSREDSSEGSEESWTRKKRKKNKRHNKKHKKKKRRLEI